MRPALETRSGSLSRQAALVYAAGGVRAACVSLIGVIVAVSLAKRGFSGGEIGLVIGTGMASSAAGTLLVGFRADAWGQRRSLIALGLLNGFGYVGVGLASSLPSLVLIAAAGTTSPLLQ